MYISRRKYVRKTKKNKDQYRNAFGRICSFLGMQFDSNPDR